MAEPRLLLALDSGTQSSRALLFDEHGTILSIGRKQHAPMKFPSPGAVEQDPHDIRDALYHGIRECLQQWGGDPSQIAGAALTTQRNTVLPLAEDGSPLMDAVSWLDRRTAGVDSEPTGWLRFLLKAMGKNAMISRLLAKSWPRIWREQIPEVVGRMHRIAPIEGWLNHELTGNVAAAPGGLVGLWPLDVKRLDWDKKQIMHKMLGYRREWLPDIVQPGQLVGKLREEAAQATGLPAGLPVYACGGDKQAEALGGGALSTERGVAAISLGTGSSICVPWPTALSSRKYLWVTMAAAEPGAYSLEYLLFRGMWTARWFARELARDLEAVAEQTGRAVEAMLCDEAATVPAGSDGLMVWPRWSPTLQHPLETGAAVGLRETHTRAHFFRALLEGIAFDLRRGLGILEKGAGMNIERIIVAGGGSRSDIVVQILADVLGLPVTRPESEELSALGAAMVAALGAGIHPTPAAAVEAMRGPTAEIKPQPETAAHYDRIYRKVYLPGLKSCHRISATLSHAR